MGERTENVIDGDLGETLRELIQTIGERRSADPEQSYTARLLAGPEEKLYKKVVEEALETVLAAKDDDHDHIRYEMADLLYHLVVLMEKKAITAAELAGELRARMV
ncbi:MAG TPA: phosphoribosyl-ATP diphosphatase [Coriobacteriia bacterium]|nr:phosphoribosyl-ATP diphosphatase [Coriobacteriia bacterium]